jgi:adenylate cyclase
MESLHIALCKLYNQSTGDKVLTNNRLPKILNWINTLGTDPGDSDDVRLEKTLLVTGGIMVIAATALWGTVYSVFNEPLAGGISFLYSATALISLIYFGITHRHQAVLFIQMLMGLVLPNLQMLSLGGFMNSSAVNLWSLISPLAALIFYGSKRAIRWWLAYLAIVVMTGFAQPFISPGNNLPGPLVIGFFVMNITAVSSIVFITLNYFLTQREEAYRLLQIEEQKSEDLLLNILPEEIAPILKEGGRTIAEQFDHTTIIFADLVGFTPLTAEMSPEGMVSLLNEVFSHFDLLVEKYDLEKIRTIGDNYLAVAGAPRPRPDHAHAVARVALEMKDYIENRPVQNGKKIQFRIGMNSGPVVGGVIGQDKFVYDIWGDAVNVASRMESHGVAGKIQITSTTYELIKSDFICEKRGPVSVKGKGQIETWFLIKPK